MEAKIVTMETEQYILRTGMGRKVMEGDEKACRAHAAKVRKSPGLQPQLKLIKVIKLEEEIDTL